MIRLVQSADAGKAKIVGLADRFATWIVVIALSAAALTWLFTGQIIRAVTILVVFCPCALVLATPTAIMAAIGNATKHGFLVREGDALEKLAKVSKITFDKTGTLTCGTHPGYSSEDIYRFCAGAEQHSEHPLGKAVLGCFKQKYGAVPAVYDFHMIPGRGVSALIEGKMILAGNMEMMTENRISFNQDITEKAEGFLAQGCTVIYVAFDGILAGFLALSDTVRMESTSMISRLHSLNVEPVLLTGDHENAAAAIAGQLHIKEVQANCLPEDKLNFIRSCQEKKELVCMIGDGVNDAPALKAAVLVLPWAAVGMCDCGRCSRYCAGG